MKTSISCVMLACFSVGLSASAQFSIDWFKISGGGGSSASGAFSITGTIGQADANEPAMTGGSFSLIGGFWSLPIAVPTSGAPLLKIAPATPGFATISWIPNTPGYVLQISPSLALPSWSLATSGATNPITVPASFPARFYRLIKQ
jgi:hypothetical protein